MSSWPEPANWRLVCCLIHKSPAFSFLVASDAGSQPAMTTRTDAQTPCTPGVGTCGGESERNRENKKTIALDCDIWGVRSTPVVQLPDNSHLDFYLSSNVLLRLDDGRLVSLPWRSFHRPASASEGHRTPSFTIQGSRTAGGVVKGGVGGGAHIGVEVKGW